MANEKTREAMAHTGIVGDTDSASAFASGVGRGTDNLAQQTYGAGVFREQSQMITFVYRNWRGEIRQRRVVPIEIVFGHDNYHQPDQWLLHAIDMEKGARRTFALEHMLTPMRKAF